MAKNRYVKLHNSQYINFLNLTKQQSLELKHVQFVQD